MANYELTDVSWEASRWGRQLWESTCVGSAGQPGGERLCPAGRVTSAGPGLCFRESEDEGGHAAGARPSACPYTPSRGPQSCPGCPARWPRGTSFSGHKGCAATPGSGCPPSRETLPPPSHAPHPRPGTAHRLQCAWRRAWRAHTRVAPAG